MQVWWRGDRDEEGRRHQHHPGTHPAKDGKAVAALTAPVGRVDHRLHHAPGSGRLVRLGLRSRIYTSPFRVIRVWKQGRFGLRLRVYPSPLTRHPGVANGSFSEGYLNE